MLGNRSYMGDEVCWKTKKSSGGRDLPRPGAERVRLPDGVRPAIVPRELWEECRGKIEARAARMNTGARHPALLRGHIFCGECGAGMVRNLFRRGKYEYLKYRCGSRWRPFATACRGEAVPLPAAHEWAWGVVQALLLERGIAGRRAEVPAPNPSADLVAARLAHEGAAHALEALLAAPAGGAALSTFVALAEGEKRRLERIVAELEEQESWHLLHAVVLIGLRQRAENSAGQLTFDEQRAALAAFGFKAYANGDDPSGWRYEVGA